MIGISRGQIVVDPPVGQWGWMARQAVRLLVEPDRRGNAAAHVRICSKKDAKCRNG